jgi:hypothetical protein
VVTVPRVRLLWVTLLLVPAAVVFAAARIAIGPIAGTERLDVVPQLPSAISLPTTAIGIATPAQRATVPVPISPRPMHAPPKTVVGHIVGSTSVGRAFTNPNAPAG